MQQLGVFVAFILFLLRLKYFITKYICTSTLNITTPSFELACKEGLNEITYFSTMKVKTVIAMATKEIDTPI